MKTNILFLIIIVVAIFLSGCESETKNISQKENTSEKNTNTSSVAVKYAKITQAQTMLRQIYTASQIYYADYMQYPSSHQFNDASTVEGSKTWQKSDEIDVQPIMGDVFFTYSIINDGEHFEVIADPSDSYDKSIRDISLMKINELGNLSGGTF